MNSVKTLSLYDFRRVGLAVITVALTLCSGLMTAAHVDVKRVAHSFRLAERIRRHSTENHRAW